MKNTTKRAWIKTLLTIGIIAIALAIGTVWPPFVAYVMATLIIGMIVGGVFLVFKTYEDDKEFNKKWK